MSRTLRTYNSVAAKAENSAKFAKGHEEMFVRGGRTLGSEFAPTKYQLLPPATYLSSMMNPLKAEDCVFYLGVRKNAQLRSDTQPGSRTSKEKFPSAW